MNTDDTTLHTLTPQLLTEFYQHNYSATDICNVIKLNREINDESFLSFLHNHPPVIQLIMSLESNQTLVWNWLKSHESLLGESFEDVSLFLSDSSPVFSLVSLDR